jgi:peptidoglycan hydrolase-like protein with peptidoglycan-binding domain
MEAEAPAARRRVRAAPLAIALALVVVSSGGWALARGGLPGRQAAAVAEPEVPTGMATVTRTDVVERQQVAGTLGYGSGSELVGQAAGVLMRLPAAGAVLTRGQTLYELDGAKVPLLYGTRPAWRGFQAGMADGPDVRQLEANLVALGHDPGHAITVDRHFGGATAAAVRRWQRVLGRPRTGAVALGQVAFVPGPVRVASAAAAVGAVVEPGTPILALTSTRPVVTVALDTAFQQLVRRGNQVQVTLPDGSAVAGTVTTIGRAAVLPDGAEQGGQGGDPGRATVTVTIGLADARAARGLDEAPVQVAIITQAHRGVLAVPVSALLAQPDGGYAVDVVSGGTRTRVPVRPGLFGDLPGLVEVAGPGLAEGATVQVPAP